MSLASALLWWMCNSLTCTLQAQRGLTGIMNYTNPGAVSHNEILQMYKDYIDPEFKWSNFSVEEQSKVIVAARSNNLLDTKRVRLVYQPFKDATLPCTDISCWQCVWLCTDWEGIPSNSVNPWLSEEVCVWAQCKEQASSACSCQRDEGPVMIWAVRYTMSVLVSVLCLVSGWQYTVWSRFWQHLRWFQNINALRCFRLSFSCVLCWFWWMSCLLHIMTDVFMPKWH